MIKRQADLWRCHTTDIKKIMSNDVGMRMHVTFLTLTHSVSKILNMLLKFYKIPQGCFMDEIISRHFNYLSL